jgi:putative cardiolipin synthase
MQALAWLRLLAAAAVVALAGCATLPGNVERRESHALTDVQATTLGKVAAASVPGDAADRSGFRLLPDADDALEARLALIRSAERSLDVQYYLIANDGTGRQFLAALVAAASRGVRVRVLVDDLYTAREDALFTALSALPGFEVRLFNPLPARSGGFATRVAFSSHQFARINRRMHNKVLIADGSFAITGGRNVADEYFDRGISNFIDMDLLSTGPVVATLAALFDEFWNSTWAYPASSLLRGRDDAARERATLLLQALGSAAAPSRRSPPKSLMAASRCALPPRASSPTRRRGSATPTRCATTARSCARTSSCSRKRARASSSRRRTSSPAPPGCRRCARPASAAFA